MGQKQDRQKKILELIEKENVTTQEDMIEHLREAGFDVTQATVSRDIREMGLVKKTDKNGICHYVEMTSHGKKGGIHNALTDSVVKVDFAGNILVIKTLPGMASAVATWVDSLDKEEVLGSIAGDDAIFVVVREEAYAHRLCQELSKKINTP
ncbi:MAG: arginine repressor [Clostridia bacterium]|nr:arginine repressor [Clostridia bacterium]